MRKIAFLLASVFALSFSAQSQDSDYSFKESFKVNELFNLAISSNNSDIEVVAQEGNEIEVFYTITKSGNVLKVTKEEMEDLTASQWKLDIQETSNNLEIKVVSTVKNGFTRSEDAIDVHFKVYVPEKTSTELKSNDGDIKIQGLALNQKCITNDGDIELKDLKGKVYAETNDGDVIVTNVSGNLETVTQDGRVIDLTDKKS